MSGPEPGSRAAPAQLHCEPFGAHRPQTQVIDGPLHVPHEPPQPSSPQLLPRQCGVQQVPFARHVLPVSHPQSDAHALQFSPVSQTPFPQTMSGMQMPPTQLSPLRQLPHEPPQPLSPQSFPVQLGAQQLPFAPQVCPDAQVQSFGQFAQLSPD